jgi:thiol-disulfide isomerase/thioredoxin
VKITSHHLTISRCNLISSKGLLIGLFVVSFFIFLSTTQAKVLPDKTAKEQLDTLIAKHIGEVIYVDFWASWCGPCRKSFPWMNEMQSRFQSKGFTVISINVDTEKKLAKTFLIRNPANFAVVYDPKGELARFFKIQGMPSSLIINKEGEIKYAHSGFFTEKTSQYEQDIQQLLAL